MKQPGNTLTFNAMLDACAKYAMPGIALIASGRDKQSPVVLDIITFSTLVKGTVATVALIVLCAWWREF